MKADAQGGAGIPAAYIDHASGERIAQAAAPARVRLVIDGEELPGALARSAGYLAGMTPEERQSLRLNINLDTVAGDDSLTALISGFPELAGLVGESAVTRA